MEDFIKTLRAQLYERVSSPLLGAFLVSWCIWNWRVFLIWVGGAELSAKLALVDEYFSGWQKWGIRGFVVPAATTAFYIYVYPWIALPVYRFVQRRQADLQRVRQEFEDEKPLPQKEARELRRALELAEQKFDALIVRKDSQIQALGNEVTSLQKALDAARPSASTSEANPSLPFQENVEKVPKTVLRPTEASLRNQFSDLTNVEREILARIFDGERGNKFVSASDISPNVSADAIEQFAGALRSMVERGLIEFENGRLRLTAPGMNMAVNVVKNPRL